MNLSPSLRPVLSALMLSLSIGILSLADAAPTKKIVAGFETGVAQNSLLELFSSEGCSSCPPAEQWLNRLRGTEGLWKEYVPVCFHVDYWDYLGWKDILSSPEYSKRQRWYETFSQASSVYTPGFFWNGFEWKGFFQGEKFPKKHAKRSGVLTVRRITPSDFKIEFIPVDTTNFLWEAHIALMGMEIVSEVKSGENAGKTIEHNFAVLTFQTVKLTKTEAGYGAKFSLTVKSDLTEKLALAAWITELDGTVPVQATGGMLTD